ncbi:MAG: hypothetical protein ACK559_24925, partial [bacterium]
HPRAALALGHRHAQASGGCPSDGTPEALSFRAHARRQQQLVELGHARPGLDHQGVAAAQPALQAGVERVRRDRVVPGSHHRCLLDARPLHGRSCGRLGDQSLEHVVDGRADKHLVARPHPAVLDADHLCRIRQRGPHARVQLGGHETADVQHEVRRGDRVADLPRARPNAGVVA